MRELLKIKELGISNLPTESVAQLPDVISKESSTEKSFKFSTKKISPSGRNDNKVVVQQALPAGRQVTSKNNVEVKSMLNLPAVRQVLNESKGQL